MVGVFGSGETKSAGSASWRASGGWDNWASNISTASMKSSGTSLRYDQVTILVLGVMAMQYQYNRGSAGRVFGKSCGEGNSVRMAILPGWWAIVGQRRW